MRPVFFASIDSHYVIVFNQRYESCANEYADALAVGDDHPSSTATE